MRCSKCGFENATGTNSCGVCGLVFEIRCSKCDAGNSATSKFCSQCGVPLHDHPTPGAGSVPQSTSWGSESAAGRVEGERRHLTVLFSDLVDSTEIASRLDPEEWRDLVASYQRAAAQALRRFGGHIAQFLG